MPPTSSSPTLNTMTTEPGSNPDWRTQGVVVIPADALDLNTPHQEINALDDQPLECVVTRSGQDPIVINLDIEGGVQPEHVTWTDPAHPADQQRPILPHA
jgi:hypothetical protein